MSHDLNRETSPDLETELNTEPAVTAAPAGTPDGPSAPMAADELEARLRFDFSRYPLITKDLPGVGGVIRQEVDDFQVEEVPAYPFAGEGDHLYLKIEKRDMNTRYLIEFLRDRLGVPEVDLGWAGLKDRRAKTWQWISVPKSAEDRLGVLDELEGAKLVEKAYHTNRLAVGHLAGNRFRILIRHPEGPPAAAQAVLDMLAVHGVPNYFGPQRFGKFGDNALRGHRLLASGKFRKTRWLDKLLANALQSMLFNEWTRLRLERGLYDTLLDGDIAVKHASGGKFQVGDAAVEAPRAKALEISATGPLFGRKYHEAMGPARAIEDEVLASFGLTRDLFRPLSGNRRPIRFPMVDVAFEAVPEGYWVSFFLPKGGFATAVLREVMKSEVDGLEEDAGEA